MNHSERAGEEPTGTDDRCIDERDQRALEQFLTVLPETGRARGAEDLFLVVSESGKEYLVDTQIGACECPDHEYQGVHCKHQRRIEFALGERIVPDGVDVDPQLGTHVDGTVRTVATDGGFVVRRNAAPAVGTAAERPEECECNGHPDEDVPCWYCYAVRFNTPNPNAEWAGDESETNDAQEAF